MVEDIKSSCTVSYSHLTVLDPYYTLNLLYFDPIL